MEREIAEQMLERSVDVMLGGGERYFTDELLSKHADLHVARSAGALDLAPASAGAGSGRLLGLFGRDHVPFMLDREPSVPSLARMTDAALARMMRSDRGFILQVEGGRIDHAAHDSDIGAVLTDQLDFDDAIGVALRYVAQDPSILLVVTTDHANGNPGLTLYGERGNAGFDRLTGVKRSFEWISTELGKIPEGDRPAAIGGLVASATGITLRERELEQLVRVMRRERVHPFDVLNSRTGVLGAVLANHFGVGFISPNHTADLVELTALGPGTESLPQIVDNTELHRLMLSAMAITPA
jgi:alkaline phosphatase